MRLRILLSTIFSLFLIGLHSQSIGIIGSATPGGWDVDTNMVQDVDSPEIWSLNLTLTDGVVKFRQDDAWTVNWGSTDFPGGIGVQDGPDIPVYAGDYLITLNTNTGAYYFDVDSDMGIIGDATPGGWDSDSELYKDQTDPNKFFTKLDLVVGGAKFRKDKDWVTNWGSADFPSGTGTQDGDNIAVSKAGTYFITIDTSTGEYNFGEEVTYTSIGIIGSATAGGWDTDTELNQNSNNPDMWFGNIDLVEGEIKFRANSDWAVSWGGPADFPSDTAIIGSNDNIAIGADQAGTYLVNFNTETGEFSFLPIVYYESIGIIGDATPGGWDNDSDMVRSETDSALWTLRIVLADGEAKFRANNDWVTADWGSGDFPAGVGVAGGANIPVTAGEYVISLNTTTGAYNFDQIFVFSTVGLIGPATPIGDWDTDVDMDKDAIDEQLWTISSIDLVDGEAKFRADDDWAKNWGAESWPSGVGVQDGDNIPIVGGTYRITLRSDDGSFSFDAPSSTNEPILNEVKLYPNPTNNLINIELNTERISGLVNIEILDVSGKKVLVTQEKAASLIRLNVSGLNPGNYFVRMYNKEFLLAKPVTIVK